MHRASRAVATLAVVVVGLCATSPAATAADGYRSASAVDGDTIHLAGGRSVRLVGYDAPEVGQCGYDAARATMTELLRRPVRIVLRSGTDYYGRLLAYVTTRNGRDVGTVMLRRGLAVARYDFLDGYAWHPKQDVYRSLDSRNGDIVCPAPTLVETPSPTPASDPVLVTPVEPSVAVTYENCDAVRAAGAAPIHLGEPGYAEHLDRDGDGVGCE